MSIQLDTLKEKTRHFAKRFLWLLLAVFVVFVTGYYLWRTWVYSDGTRAGILFKISERGYMFKTFEGQIHQGGSVMLTDQSIFNFSVENRATYLQLQQCEGKNVRLSYHEVNDAFPWQGDTNYLVYKVELVQQ